MNNSTLDVVRRKLEFSRSCVESLNKASRESQYPDNVGLFEDLAKVFESARASTHSKQPTDLDQTRR